jgi:hypothetical protein
MEVSLSTLYNNGCKIQDNCLNRTWLQGKRQKLSSNIKKKRNRGLKKLNIVLSFSALEKAESSLDRMCIGKSDTDSDAHYNVVVPRHSTVLYVECRLQSACTVQLSIHSYISTLKLASCPDHHLL